MKIKTDELTGIPLNWAVARAIGYADWDGECFTTYENYPGAFFIEEFKVSTDWAKAGPLIDKYNISWDTHHFTGDRKFAAMMWRVVVIQNNEAWERTKYVYGPTQLIAAMRCLVVSLLGDEVEIPEELV
jgi:hypothetical protein